LTTFDIVVGVLSIALAVMAIWLSWKLYQMSEEGARRMRQSEDAIAHHVKELDRLYGVLYSDTWSLVRDTYTTMQDRMWGAVSATNGQGARPDRPAHDQASTSSGPARILADPSEDEVKDETEDPGRLNDFLVDSYHRLSERGERVRAQELISIAERLGYPFDDALNALHNVVFVEKRLYLASKRFSPFALVANSAEEAARLQDKVADETMDELTRETPSRETDQSERRI
jgi:hypothetical protein